MAARRRQRTAATPLDALVARALEAESGARISGLRGAARAQLTARLATAGGERPVLVLTPDSKAADLFASDLRVHLGYTMEMGETTIEWFVNGRNLTDDEQRYHTSFIKDLAPQPGRTIEGGVRIQL